MYMYQYSNHNWIHCSIHKYIRVPGYKKYHKRVWLARALLLPLGYTYGCTYLHTCTCTCNWLDIMCRDFTETSKILQNSVIKVCIHTHEQFHDFPEQQCAENEYMQTTGQRVATESPDPCPTSVQCSTTNELVSSCICV